MCIISGLVALTASTSVAAAFGAVGAGAAASVGATVGTTAATAIGVGVTVAADLAILGTALSGTLSTISSVEQAKAQAAQAEAQMEIELENARLEARRAERVELEGNQKRLALYNEMQQRQGTARATYGAAGVVLGAGSAAEYEADIADAYDLDRRNLDYDIASEAYSHKVASVSHRNQAAYYKAVTKSYDKQAKNSLTTGIFTTAGSTLLSAVGAFTGISALGTAGATAASSASQAGTLLKPMTDTGILSSKVTDFANPMGKFLDQAYMKAAGITLKPW